MIQNEYIEKCLNGEFLYGNNFDEKEIKKWFEEEKEGYSNLDSKELEDLSKDNYHYDNLNLLYGFKHVKKQDSFKKVLGIGAAGGHEFKIISSRIESLYILEPSEELKENKVNNLRINYKSPNISGKIEYEDEKFDLITCFGVLHHIPNVSFVFSEISRVLSKDGFFLVREPIISMGDWRRDRKGLTKNERGIPIKVFKEIIKENNLEIVAENYCFTFTTLINRIFSKFLKHPVYYYNFYLYLDKIISNIFKNNIKYHNRNKFDKFYPQNVYFVLKKK